VAPVVAPRPLLTLLLLVSCERTPAPTTDAMAAVSSAPATSAPTASIALPTSTAPSVVVKVGDYTADRAVVERWNAALDAHDVTALAPLYSAIEVVYYGAHVDGATCVKRARAALARDPSYRQSIAITNVETYDDDAHATVFFTKRNGDKSYDAYVVIDRATLKIVEESDRTTNKSLVKSGSCVAYESEHTFVGTLSQSSYIHHDKASTSEYIAFDHPVCVVELEPDANQGAQPQAPRSDVGGILVQMTDNTDVSATLEGKHVAATGMILRHAVTDATNNWLSVTRIAVR
jgi:hypothetical protein